MSPGGAIRNVSDRLVADPGSTPDVGDREAAVVYECRTGRTLTLSIGTVAGTVTRGHESGW
jgi:hypothetical protein